MDFSIDAIPMLSTIMSQNKIMENVGTAMLSNAIDVSSEGMANLTKAMELSVNPDIGSNFDVSI